MYPNANLLSATADLISTLFGLIQLGLIHRLKHFLPLQARLTFITASRFFLHLTTVTMYGMTRIIYNSWTTYKFYSITPLDLSAILDLPNYVLLSNCSIITILKWNLCLTVVATIVVSFFKQLIYINFDLNWKNLNVHHHNTRQRTDSHLNRSHVLTGASNKYFVSQYLTGIYCYTT